ncbi:MAG: adenosylhomocysteinase, partial [Myxococcales bacterium]|nr:adenosylhomocysteinase [Myxococcales bacterium]
MTTENDHHDRALAARGRDKIAWAERSMPALRAIRERFTRERPLADIRVAACMHVTAETAALVRTLAAGGAALRLCASNPLSTQDDVAASLAIDDGLAVFARAGVGREGYFAHLEAALEGQPQV